MLNYFIFHSLCLLAFWAFYQIILKKDTFFERNRYYLLLTALLACFAPLLEVSVSQEDIQTIGMEDFVLLPALEISSSLIKQLTSENISDSQNSTGTFYLVKLIYASGVAISLILFLVRLGKLLILIKVSPKGGDVEGALIVIPNENAGTFSFFNYLFWDGSLNFSEKEKQQILLHELAHIRGKHSYDLIFIELQKIVFWFNPLIYLYQKEIINQHEFIADSKALRLSNTAHYISLMVSSLFKSLQLNFIHSFHNQQIKQRIKMLNTQKTSWIKGNTKTVLAVAFVGVIAGAVACSNALTSIEKDQKLSEMKVAQGRNQKDLNKSYIEELDILLEKYTITDIKKDGKIEITTKEIPDKKDRERVIFLMKELKNHFLERTKQNLVKNPDANGIYTVVESMASPIGGMSEMYKLMAKEMRYPQEARQKGLEGTVFVEFVVNTDGSLQDIKVLKGVENSPKLDEIVVVGYQDQSAHEQQAIREGLANSLHEEAMRVVALTKWEAGAQDGKKVRQRLVMPIAFKLD
jgi:beta-lactamase regulating signal transducer with metallopeptidase domain